MAIFAEVTETAGRHLRDNDYIQFGAQYDWNSQRTATYTLCPMKMIPLNIFTDECKPAQNST